MNSHNILLLIEAAAEQCSNSMTMSVSQNLQQGLVIEFESSASSLQLLARSFIHPGTAAKRRVRGPFAHAVMWLPAMVVCTLPNPVQIIVQYAHIEPLTNQIQMI